MVLSLWRLLIIPSTLFILTCESSERIYVEPFNFPNTTHPFTWDIIQDNGIIIWSRGTICNQYLSSPQCLDIQGGTIIQHTIPTPNYHSIHLEIDTYQENLLPNEWCYLQYKFCSSAAWINVPLVSNDDIVIFDRKIIISDTNIDHNQSSLHIRLVNNATSKTQNCYFKNLEIFGIKSSNTSAAPTSSPAITSNDVTQTPSNSPTKQSDLIPTAFNTPSPSQNGSFPIFIQITKYKPESPSTSPADILKTTYNNNQNGRKETSLFTNIEIVIMICTIICAFTCVGIINCINLLWRKKHRITPRIKPKDPPSKQQSVSVVNINCNDNDNEINNNNAPKRVSRSRNAINYHLAGHIPHKNNNLELHMDDIINDEQMNLDRIPVDSASPIEKMEMILDAFNLSSDDMKSIEMRHALSSDGLNMSISEMKRPEINHGVSLDRLNLKKPNLYRGLSLDVFNLEKPEMKMPDINRGLSLGLEMDEDDDEESMTLVEEEMIEGRRTTEEYEGDNEQMYKEHLQYKLSMDVPSLKSVRVTASSYDERNRVWKHEVS